MYTKMMTKVIIKLVFVAFTNLTKHLIITHLRIVDFIMIHFIHQVGILVLV